MPRPGQPRAADLGRTTDLMAIGMLMRAFPPSLVDRIVDECGRGEQRRRLLPARVVVYFVLAMCLFSRMSYKAVADLLAEGMTWARYGSSPLAVPTTAAISRARAKLGPEPLKALFSTVAATPIEAREGRRATAWHWRTFALDATAMSVPGTPENCEWFGLPGGPSPGRPPLPQMLVTVLAECGTRAIIRAAVGPCTTGTWSLAADLLDGLGPGDLLLADSRFCDVRLVQVVRASGADVLCEGGHGHAPPRARGHDALVSPAAVGGPGARDGLVPPVAHAVADGGTPHPAHASPRLITGARNRPTAPRPDLLSLFRQRWTLQESPAWLWGDRDGALHVLRSRWPGGVEQELWGCLLVEHALRSLTQLPAASDTGDGGGHPVTYRHRTHRSP
ncbi:transposase domain-containing protein [Streptomyces olivaceus]|uniref:transposase domain-containing protein n=1 Tax=Streptomyces olivaceus TaxID=47716 RepID=UPI0033AF03D5